MKTVNIKIENNSKEKVIIVRKLFNKDIILTLNLVKIKNHMMKKISWITTLKLQTYIIRIRFIIMIKHVIKNIISQSNQKTIITEINAQNLKIHNIIKILYIEYSKRDTQDSARIM
jgi:hypothetical protein